MATLQTLLADFTTFKADMTTTLARVQADLDKLKTSNLSPADQATLDAIDQGVKDADATLKAFDVPTAEPPPAQ